MAQYTKIKCGRLYDGLTDDVRTDVEVLIEDDRIKEVDGRVSTPIGAETIDLSREFVTPGLSDAHVHFSIGDWHTRSRDTIYEAPIYKGMYALHNANRSLKRGFTSVRHCGSNCDDGYSIVTAKRMINAGWFEGARLVVAPHYVGTTSSHADTSKLIGTNPYVADFIWDRYPGRGSGSDMFREVVRRQAKFGADFIKMFATGGFNSIGDGPEDIMFTDDELRSVIDTSHQLGLKVTSHSYAPPLIWKQLEMGIDGIEHGALIDDPKLLQAMKTAGIEFVPTFSPYDSVIETDKAVLDSHTPEMREKLLKYAEWLRRAREIIVASDIELGYGSDFVAAHYPYESGWEYKSMIKSGVEPFRALAAATRVNAKILGMPNDIGAVAPGRKADIAAWCRDPLTDAEALLDCAFVMKDGVVYETEGDI